MNFNFVINFHLTENDERLSVFINNQIFGFSVDGNSVSIQSHLGEFVELDFQTDVEAHRAYNFIHDCITNELKVQNGVYNFEEVPIETRDN